MWEHIQMWAKICVDHTHVTNGHFLIQCKKQHKKYYEQQQSCDFKMKTSCYMQVLQEANDELEDRIKSVQKGLEESTAEMNKMTDEYTKLKVRIALCIILARSTMQQLNLSLGIK